MVTATHDRGQRLREHRAGPTTDELRRTIDDHTDRRVRQLAVDRDGHRVRVTGTSTTFYVKQLVTRAVRAALPHVELDNAVRVRAPLE